MEEGDACDRLPDERVGVRQAAAVFFYCYGRWFVGGKLGAPEHRTHASMSLPRCRDT